MVTLLGNGKSPLVAIDAVGAGVVAVGVLGFVWLTLVQTDDTRAEIVALTKLITDSQRDLASVREIQARQQRLLAKSTGELARRGRLPHQTPIEDYFQTLSELAANHHLRMLRNRPLTPREYPGLLEQRYTCELVGSMPDITRFFQAIEGTTFWADVSYFKIANMPGDPREGVNGRVAELTLSLFSAPALEEDSTSQG